MNTGMHFAAANPRSCCRCGQEVSARAPAGVCTRCALEEALHAPPGTGAQKPTFDDLLPGKDAWLVLGDYELLDFIASGGMGAVYRARQRRLNRIVAVKILSDGARPASQLQRRFRKEAEAAARLHHPNIVPIYEVGEEGGRLYYSMEYVPGQDLARLVCHHPLEPRRAAAYVRTVAEAVHHAHEQGILHRDLKPSNILLGEDDRPRVSDFGLAKELSVESSLTVTGQTVGSPGYLPPEQASATRGAVGRYSDIYSLGAVLYHLLTGRPPFVTATLADTLQQVLHEEPIAPRRLNSIIPASLEAICLQCLEKAPERRYPTAVALADDLQRFLNQQPVAARPGTAWTRVRRWCGRNTVWLGATFAVSAILFTGAIVSGRIARQATKSQAGDESGDELLRQQVEAERADKQRQLERAEWLAYAHQLAEAQRYWEAGEVAAARQWLADCRPSRRGWEHRYWQRLFHPEVATWHGHRNIVYAVACSPDGTRVATGSRDQTIRLWEAATGKSLGLLAGHRAWVNALVFASDGQLISGDHDGLILVWDTGSAQVQRRLESQSSPVRSLAATPGGKQVIAGHQDGTVRVWDLAAEKPPRIFPGQGGGVLALALQSASRRLASGTDNRLVNIWDLDRGARLAAFREHTMAVAGLAFTPDGRQLITAGHDGLVKVWDRGSDRITLTLHGHRGAVHSVRVSPEGQWLASAGSDHRVIVWDVVRGTLVRILQGHTGEVTDLAFSPDGRRLFTASADTTVKVWDPQEDRGGPRILSTTGGVTDLAFDPEGRWFVTTGKDRKLVQWHLRPPATKEPFAPWLTNATAVAVSPDGRRILCGSLDGGVRLLDARSGELLHHFEGHEGPVRAVAFGHPGDRLASGSDDTTVRLWSSTAQRLLHTCRGHVGRVTDVLFSPGGHRVYSSGLTDSVRIWDAQHGRSLGTVGSPASPPGNLAVSHDGQWLAASSGPRLAHVWDLTTRREVHVLAGHNSRVSSLAFCPAGQRLATAGEDRVVRLWDVRSGQAVMAFHGQPGPIRAVAFSPDGQQLVAATLDGQISIWDASPFAGRTGQVKTP